ERRRLDPLVATLCDVGLTGRDTDPECRDRVEVRGLLGEREGDLLVTVHLDAELRLCGGKLSRRRSLRVHRVPGFAARDDVRGEGVLAGDRRVAGSRRAVSE